METIIIKPKNGIIFNFFAATFIVLFSSVFILVGLDFSTVKCVNNICEIKKEFSILGSPDKEIIQIKEVFLHEKRSTGKSNTIVSNVVLKNKNNEISVFAGYTNVNKYAKEDVLKDLKSFLNKEIDHINKTYGDITVFFYVGLVILLVGGYMLYKSLKKVVFPIQIIIDNKKLSIRNRNTKNQHLLKYSDIDEIKLVEGNEALRYRHPILYKYKVTVEKQPVTALVIILKNKIIIDIGGIGYEKENLMQAKNKLESFKI